MFEVTSLLRRLPTKIVELTALEEMAGNHRILRAGRHRSKIFECPYDFAKGTNLVLGFVPWKRLKVGDRLDVATVLRHRSAEKWLLRCAGGGGWR